MSQPMLTVHPVPAFKDNYIWTIVNKENKTAVIVDPGDAMPVKNYLKNQQLQPVAILITHHHWDHMNGVQGLKQIFDIPVFGPRREKVEGVTVAVGDKDTVSLPADFPLTLQVLDIPGHTLGHVAYYSPEMVFSGDTLFAVGCGRLFEGTAAQMVDSLAKLAALPDETRVYCGHEYTLNNLRFAELVEPTNKDIASRIKQVSMLREKNQPSLPSSIADEKKTNPFLRCQSPELIKNVEKFAGRPLNNALEVFTELRHWKDNF